MGTDPEHLWAYGNSRGDLRMLGAADVGVNVGRLGRFGRLRAFSSLPRCPEPIRRVADSQTGAHDRAAVPWLPGTRPRCETGVRAGHGGDLARRFAGQRYSRRRIHTRKNHPQMGGR